jgi:hypothetical protein
MSFATSDTKDVQEATNAAQESDAATKPLSPTGMKAMQGGNVDYPSPDQWPKSATTELGDASRAEGAEKPEVKWHHEISMPGWRHGQ